jgi:hypothetical protein
MSSFSSAPFAALDKSQQIIWQPQEGPQTALIECPVFEVFFGGARGGGKTEGSIGDWLQHSSQYGEDAIGIFVRRQFKQLKEVIARCEKLFKKLGAVYNRTRAEFTMANGARLAFVHLERDADAENYQGHSYTRVYIEEVTNFPSPGPIMKLKGTLRSAEGVPCGMRLTGNPGGPGHLWVKARYIDPCPKGYKLITETEDIEIDGEIIPTSISRVFIPSRISDNKLLLRNNPTYVLGLRQTGSEALVKAWLEGDWDAVDGAFFDEFSFDKHVLAAEWMDRIPRNCLKFCAFDWGSAHPFSVGWYAMSDGTWGLPKGAILKYREWYGAKAPNVGIKMGNPEIAMGILEREKEDKEKGWKITYRVGDPAVHIRSGGPSINEQMSIKGVSWNNADNKRIPGAEMMHNRLKGDDGIPMLYFLETCEDTIRTIPYLQHDEKNPEDIDTEMEDHAYDETRYAVMSRPWLMNITQPEGIHYPKHPMDMTFNEIIARQTQIAKKAADEF